MKLDEEFCRRCNNWFELGPYPMSDREKEMYELLMEVYKAPYWVRTNTETKHYAVEVRKDWFKRIELLTIDH